MPRNLTGVTAPTARADARARAAKWADPKVCARALLTPEGYSGVEAPPPRNWGDPPAAAPPIDPALAAKLAELKACAESLVMRGPWVIGPSPRALRRLAAANIRESADQSSLPAGWQRLGLGYDAAGNPVDPAKAAKWADPKVCAQALLSRNSAGPYVPPVKRAPAAGGRGQDGARRPMDADRAARWSDPRMCAQVLLSSGSCLPPPPPGAPAAESAEVLERSWNPELHPRGGYAQNRGWFSKTMRRATKFGRRVFGQPPATKPDGAPLVERGANAPTTFSSKSATRLVKYQGPGSPDSAAPPRVWYDIVNGKIVKGEPNVVKRWSDNKRRPGAWGRTAVDPANAKIHVSPVPPRRPGETWGLEITDAHAGVKSEVLGEGTLDPGLDSGEHGPRTRACEGVLGYYRGVCETGTRP